MAYVVDLEDDYAENDVPCTTIRSKADCPSLEVCTHLSNIASHLATALQGHPCKIVNKKYTFKKMKKKGVLENKST